MEKTIINNAVNEAIKDIDFHLIDKNLLSIDAINKRSEEYFFNMDFVMRNINKLKKITCKYREILDNIYAVNDIYEKVLRQILEKSANDRINTYLFGKKDEKLSINIEEYLNNIDIFNGYYTSLKSNKIRLTDDKIYSKCFF